MNHSIQKLLCLILTAALMFSSVPFAHAQEAGEETQETFEEPAEEPEDLELEEEAPEDYEEDPDFFEEPEDYEEVPESFEEEPEDSEEGLEPGEEEPQEDQPWGEKPDFPLFFQSDYADVRYANGTIESNGCGIVALAMVATYLTGHEYTPDVLADYFGGYPGNNIEKVENASTQLKLPWKKAVNWHETVAALERGCVAIVLMSGRSSFSNYQHFLVVRGLTADGKALVSDPKDSNYSRWSLKDGFENGFPQGYITTGYDGSWYYDPSAMPEEPFIYEPAEKPDPNPRYSDIQLTLEEEDLLAAVVWVESRGESPEGQQAVAEVVFNRLKSEKYGDTLHEVIFGEGQFRSVPFLDDAEPTQTQYDAIKRAYRGPYVLAEGVTRFARKAETPYVWGRIGGHTFCYDTDPNQNPGETE